MSCDNPPGDAASDLQKPTAPEVSRTLRPSGTPGTDAATPPSVNSADLLRGHRELLIHHDGETYRLRLTRTGKLVLNK
jgi:hemin uptake protein HemP